MNTFDFVNSFDGVPIHYRIEGSGEICLIFIHGWGASIEAWEYQRALHSKYKLVFIDLAGHGKSGKDREIFTLRSFAEDVKAVVNKHKLTKIILIGWSMGGAVMLEAAQLFSERIIGLLGVDTLFPQFNYISTDPVQVEKELEPYREDFHGALAQLLDSFMTKNIDPGFAKEIAELIKDLDPRSMLSALEELYKWDLRELFSDIQKPIRCIVAGDTIPGKDEREKYEKYFQTVYMEGLKHFLVYEAPQEFNELLMEQIRDILSVTR